MLLCLSSQWITEITLRQINTLAGEPIKEETTKVESGFRLADHHF